ncbi:GGDEF domain-containing protein [Maioricimonas sp. JC845]|uniref:sensor domain-containing diguanylate cyclase n=1 Tax=Maioricimonas sp. JC845 TaxID=3232138 RepID=UPI00345A8861
MQAKLAHISRLPSLPTVAVQVVQAFSDPDVGVQEIAQILRTDPAITGKILQAANSSRFATGRQISDIHRALMILGKKVVSSLALSFSLAEASMNNGPHVEYFKSFWLQSFVQGLTSELLAESEPSISNGEAFTVGLLASVGRLAMLKGMSDDYIPCVDAALELGLPVHEIETERLPFTSTEVSVDLLGQWKLPEYFRAAVELQHTPTSAMSQVFDSQDSRMPHIVAVAVAVGEYFAGGQRGLALARLYEMMEQLLERPASGVDELLEDVRKRLEENASLFEIDLAQLGTPMELLADAMQQLSFLAATSVLEEDPQQRAPSELMEENGRLRKRVAELTRQSSIDPLTSVFNRAYFSRRIGEEIAVASIQSESIGLLIADVDRFKQVNDTYGHLMGDAVLREVAQTLQNTIRGNDFVARFGGEEFVVLVRSADLDGLVALGERLREAVASTQIEFDGLTISVTISVGGALGLPTDRPHRFEESLFASADASLYSAKNSGRNRVIVGPLEFTGDGGAVMERPRRSSDANGSPTPTIEV